MKFIKPLLIVIGLIGLVLIGFFAFNHYIYTQKQADTTIAPPFEGEVTGEYVCLPHKDTSGPQTMECAYGLKLPDDTYYALDFGQNQDPSQFQTGQTVTLTGRFTPVEVLSTDHWFKYDIEGIFSVKSDTLQPSPTTDTQGIRLQSPEPEAHVSSPLVVRGEAVGGWFFEASFPVVLTDWDGRIIAETYAQALSDWMTPEFVPFEATLEFEKPEYGERGFLILQKANPSGLPENDAAHEITIFFE